MIGRHKKLFLEMLFIVLAAVAAGIAWNHRLLQDVYNGKYPEITTSSEAATTGDIPLPPASLEQVKILFDGKEAVFVDARESAVFHRGHIAGAESLPIAASDSVRRGFTERVPPETLLILYCSGYGCRDSKILGKELADKGYSQILIFEGGYPEWKNAGFPIEETRS